MSDLLKKIIENTFFFRLNKNQFRILERLFAEISKRENCSPEKIISYLKNDTALDKYSGGTKFLPLEKSLLKKRFPLTNEKEKINLKNVFLNKLNTPLSENWQVNKPFSPLKILVENEIKDSYLVKNFKHDFPETEVLEVNSYRDYFQKNKFTISELKKPLVFLVKERWDFIKRCPCAKKHLNCGYWIFNLGFGCPFDCSYCFLQQYSNFPGITLPANIEDFFVSFDKFYKNLKKPIRIGTGEFCDSLALDDITKYSKLLIPYFSQKDVLFELKTKSDRIANLLTLKPSKNIIISWSLSPEAIIKNEEKGTASLAMRLKAAKKVQDAGFRVGFHFDPIIHSKEWEKLYGELIRKLYSRVTPPFAWISLGTLRCQRRLKTITELRFPQSNIFYGELFLGTDKKLRYPKFIKEEVYRKIIKEIRLYDKKTPIYLCMENRQIWNSLKGLVPPNNIESSLTHR